MKKDIKYAINKFAERKANDWFKFICCSKPNWENDFYEWSYHFLNDVPFNSPEDREQKIYYASEVEKRIYKKIKKQAELFKEIVMSDNSLKKKINRCFCSLWITSIDTVKLRYIMKMQLDSLSH